MKRTHPSQWQVLSLSRWLQYSCCKQVKQPNPKGFTLIELLVAGLITTVVVSIIFVAFLTALKANKRAEALTRRRIDLSRAFDFISNEIRMASNINQTATVDMDGGTPLADVITSSGLSLADLGGYGTLVLYLEIPIANVPDTCPDGSAPPAPAEYDRVVYDIRASTSDWLPPRSIHRYGRIPRLDGSIDACSTPVSSDILVDAINDSVSSVPTCNAPAVLTGTEGFHSCVEDAQVALYFESSVAGTEVHELTSNVSSRLTDNSEMAPVLSGTRQSGTDLMDLSWTWTGPLATFTVYQSIDGGAATEVYSGGDLAVTQTLGGSSGDNICYTVTATMGLDTSPASNSICEIK